MDIYKYLKEDHKNVKQLFAKLKHANSFIEKLGIFNNIEKELLIHAKSEQETFYAELMKHDKSLQEAQHATEEHDEIESTIMEINKLVSDQSEWINAVNRLQKIVEHHVSEEEGTMFDMAKDVLTLEEAEVLTDAMKAKKMNLMVSGEINKKIFEYES